MKSMTTFLILTFAAIGLGQESNLLAKCIGKPLIAYNQAFDQTYVEHVTTSHGPASTTEFKTGSAAIDVFQYGKTSMVTEIVADFYQVPTLTWRKALEELGLSEAGVTAKHEGTKFHLKGIKTMPNLILDATFDTASKKNFGNPSMSIVISKKAS